MTINPFAIWLDLARTQMQIIEALTGTQAVLQARMPMLYAAWQSPLTADHRELSLMVTEKLDAYGKATTAQARSDRTMRRALAANARDLSRLSAGTFLWPHEWLKIMDRNWTATRTLFAIAGKTVTPYHKAVTANASRLTR